MSRGGYVKGVGMSGGWVCPGGGYVQGLVCPEGEYPPTPQTRDLKEVGTLSPWTWNLGCHRIWLTNRWYVYFLVKVFFDLKHSVCLDDSRQWSPGIRGVL